jgi:hypothetical protein
MKRELDFIVIGAQKAGTTTLFEYLKRHPQLALPANKEAPYFSHDDNYARRWEDYLGKAFPFAEPGRKWGTVTTHYMVGGLYEASSESIKNGAAGDERTVPERIRERLPDVRLIAVLRDPAERAVSHHRMMAMTGAEQRPFADAIEALLEPEALERARRIPRETSGYVVWGEYGRILAGYLDVFPSEQLLVVYSEDLRRAPAEVLATVHGFIGVDHMVPENLGESYRIGASTRRFRRLNLYELQHAVSDSRAIRSLWRTLPPTMRRRIDQSFEQASYRVDLWNRRGEEGSGAPAATTSDRLREHYLADAQRLAELTGLHVPWQQ